MKKRTLKINRNKVVIVSLLLYVIFTILLVGVYWFTPYFDLIALSKTGKRLCGLSQEIMGITINATAESSPDKSVAGWVQFCRYIVPIMR